MIFQIKITPLNYVNVEKETLDKFEYIKTKIFNNLKDIDENTQITYNLRRGVITDSVKARYFIKSNGFIITQDFPINKEFDEDEIIGEIKPNIIKKYL